MQQQKQHHGANQPHAGPSQSSYHIRMGASCTAVSPAAVLSQLIEVVFVFKSQDSKWIFFINITFLIAQEKKCNHLFYLFKFVALFCVFSPKTFIYLSWVLFTCLGFFQAKDIMSTYQTGILENSAKMVLLFHLIEESVKKRDKLLVFR